jgi:hypothetical protein
MTPSDFNRIVARRVRLIDKVLASKAKEYADGQADRLHNFKMGAEMSRTSPERALWGYLTKHLVSVLDMVCAADEEMPPPAELIDEKIGDCINYFILLEGLFVERLQAAGQPLPPAVGPRACEEALKDVETEVLVGPQS